MSDGSVGDKLFEWFVREVCKIDGQPNPKTFQETHDLLQPATVHERA